MKGKQFRFIELSETEYIPEQMEDGVVYVGRPYCSAGLLCPCGCGDKIFLRIESNVHPCWNITGNTIDPSIKRLDGCLSHFVIKNGEVQ